MIYLIFAISQPLIQAHEIGDRIEALLKKEIPGVDVLMHLDPEAEPDDDF